MGKTYKRKVVLTNVSYSVNYCKLVGVTEHLKDFIQLQSVHTHLHSITSFPYSKTQLFVNFRFDPPGQMSAGLTCELSVTFKPMVSSSLVESIVIGPTLITSTCERRLYERNELLEIFFFQINEDLVGEVKFLSQTGPFSIPLICSTKKCSVSEPHNQ